jgi:hypothetical protein
MDKQEIFGNLVSDYEKDNNIKPLINFLFNNQGVHNVTLDRLKPYAQEVYKELFKDVEINDYDKTKYCLTKALILKSVIGEAPSKDEVLNPLLENILKEKYDYKFIYAKSILEILRYYFGEHDKEKIKEIYEYKKKSRNWMFMLELKEYSGVNICITDEEMHAFYSDSDLYEAQLLFDLKEVKPSSDESRKIIEKTLKKGETNYSFYACTDLDNKVYLYPKISKEIGIKMEIDESIIDKILELRLHPMLKDFYLTSLNETKIKFKEKQLEKLCKEFIFNDCMHELIAVENRFGAGIYLNFINSKTYYIEAFKEKYCENRETHLENGKNLNIKIDINEGLFKEITNYWGERIKAEYSIMQTLSALNSLEEHLGYKAPKELWKEIEINLQIESGKNKFNTETLEMLAFVNKKLQQQA